MHGGAGFKAGQAAAAAAAHGLHHSMKKILIKIFKTQLF
jgi:hypothetical protein